MTLSVIVALAEGFEEIEAVTPTDILRRAGLNVATAGLSGQTVTGAHGIVLAADQTWNDVASSTPNVLVLPGGMPGSKNLGKHQELRQMAERVDAAGGWLAALCAAPAFTLAAWGRLSGRRATCYPGCELQFPDDAKYEKQPVVVDGHIVTACGPGVAHDFSFTLIELLLNAETADRLRIQMQYAAVVCR